MTFGSVVRRLARLTHSWCLGVSVLNLALAAAAQVPGPTPVVTPHAVILPGHETVLLDIIGRGVEFPGQCKLAGGQAGGKVIRASYNCATSRVVVELRHPTNPAAADAPATDAFAITVIAGSPPAGFVDALREHIRAREQAFTWGWTGAPGED